ncbi:MAG: hypothetical protein F9K48_03300 [Candidatus Brocadia sp.]|nr:MAG: hypothetical protein F9K48_03300 [Candidatus Brocadia sp.]
MNIAISRQNMKQLYKQLRNRFRYKRIKSQKRKEIGCIFANNPCLKEYALNIDLNAKIRSFWKKRGLSTDIRWHKAFMSVNGIEDHRYIPEDIFYIFIEPRLNRKDLYHAYVDKNNYDRLFHRFCTPKTILRNMNGQYYDENYERIELGNVTEYLKKFEGEFIVKPSIDSSSGRSIVKLQIDTSGLWFDGKSATLENIEHIVPKDFLVQEFLAQHSVLKNIYPHSLNTFRVVTLRVNGDIHVLQSIVKFGCDGNYVDYNVYRGGFHCGVGFDGKLDKFALDKNFKKYPSHPNTGYVYENTLIPQFSMLLNFAKDLHRYLLYYNMVSWDLGLDRNGTPVLIELNLINQGISFLQAHHGPLFGDFTEAILEGNLKCFSV